MENNIMSQSMSVLTSKKTQEWYTPEDPYIKMVREVFDGVIQLDPASNKFAQEWIGANIWYGPDHNYPNLTDGLNREWDYEEWKYHTVFCNPPYCGKSAEWVKKAEKEYQNSLRCYGFYSRKMEIILLLNNASGYKWFEDMMDKWVTCSVRERIKFIDERGNQNGQAKKASVFAYMGHRASDFIDVFEKIGRIAMPTVHEDYKDYE